MRHFRLAFVPLLVAALLLILSSGARAQAPGSATPAASHTLPLLQDRVPEAYRQNMPLPYGVSFTYFHLDERLALSDPVLQIPALGQTLQPPLVDTQSLKAVTRSYTAKFDAWLFPFLNVYATATKFSGVASDIKATSLIPTLPVQGLLPASVDYDGKGFGFGFTAAFGYRSFFAAYNVSWSWNYLKMPTNTERATIQGPRAGIRLPRVSVYAGAMREHYAGRQTGSIDMPGIGALAFDLVAEPQHSWNPALGAEIGISRNIHANVEYGFSGRNQLMLGAGYRFGGK